MDGFFILLGLAVLSMPLGLIFLWVGHIRLRRRLAALEDRLATLGAVPATQAAPTPEAAATPPGQPAGDPLAEPVAEAGPLADLVAAATPWGGGRLAPAAPAQPNALQPPAPQPPAPPRPDRLAPLVAWLRESWVYVVSALSLALAGVFFVQYGIEKGLIPPALRVALAVGFGAALIALGEQVRRRWGDGVDVATAYLPSVFSGAGLVAMFAGIAAGRLMYGLYGPGLTFAGLLATAAGAIWLGWRHGPLLVTVGLIGAAATPFLLGGGAAPPLLLYAHYALIAAVALAVDAVRRWGWVSVLGLVLGFAGLWLMRALGGSDSGFLVAQPVMVWLALVLPPGRIVPDQPAPCLTEALVARKGRGARAQHLAAGTLLAAMPGLVIGYPTGAEMLLALLLLAGLAAVPLALATRAPGLVDLALIPALALLVRLPLSPGLDTFAPAATLMVATAAVGVLAAAQSLRTTGWPALGLALFVALFAPLTVAAIELLRSADPGSPYPRALLIMALAAVMVAKALAFARADGRAGRRSAWAALSALALIALALFLILSSGALTLALCVLLLAAAALDRRFDLFEMGWAVQAGAAVLGWRLAADPGVDWALAAPLMPVLAAYGGAAVSALVARQLLPEPRVLARGVMETASFSAAALLANILIARALLPDPDTGAEAGVNWLESHWGLALSALPWLLMALGQVHRAALGGALARFRLWAAAAAALLAAVPLTGAVTLANPLFEGDWRAQGRVLGPVLADSLALAYGLPGLVLLAAARWLNLPRLVRRVVQGLGAALAVLWAITEIRRLWWGDWLGASAVLQGELYSYTLALLACGAALLWQALARRSAGLRRIAMAVIALTVAKVFLWDAAGLSGLTRVLSFAGLGLSLAGLAWLNRWARGSEITDNPQDPST